VVFTVTVARQPERVPSLPAAPRLASSAMFEADPHVNLPHAGITFSRQQPVERVAGAHALLDASVLGRDAFSPSFDATGRSLYFHAGRAAAPLMRAVVERGAVTRVTSILDDGAANYHAVPSPDGTLIAFDSDRDGERGVYVARADGSMASRVSGTGFGAVPSWSPDGQRIAFVKSEAGKPKVWNLWIAELRTGTITRVTHDAVGQPWGASWFPDGRHIAFSRERQLVILDLTTGAATRFPSPVPGRLVRTPSVSPDGARVVFQVYREGVWVFDVARRRMQRLLDDRSAEEFAWSPDGSQIVFHTRRGSNWGVWAVQVRS
jgi:Tol biopolymer transport system component